MLGTSRTAGSAGAWLATAGLLCAMTALSPDAARAQTASNLNCNKCVNTKDVAKKAVTKSRIKNKAVTFGKLHPSVEGAIKQDQTFYVTLDSSGAVATLATQGPLRLFARCFVNVAGADRIEIVNTSSVNGWFVMGDTTARIAGEEVILPVPAVPTGTTANLLVPFPGVPGAIAPDGSAIVPVSLTGIGFNVFGHRCLVNGSATVIAGTP